jgi:hypothetical protein
MQRLSPHVRLETLRSTERSAPVDHVRGHIAPVDVVPGPQPRQEQPARAATRVEGGLPTLDELPEIDDLRPADVELRPPVGDEAVVPLTHHV